MIAPAYKVDILAFGAHPDDVECAAGGVLLKHIAMGRTAAIVDLTAGEMGTYGDRESRRKEAESSSAILGIKYLDQLGLPDGGIENTAPYRLKVMEVIRKHQPEIVLANAINDRHPDHAQAAKLVADAAFLSGLIKNETMVDGLRQNAWRPRVVYHYIQDYLIAPDFVVDISEQMDKKIESIMAFTSQFVQPKNNEPNSIMNLIDQIKNMNSIFGRPINCRYAEGFTTGRYIGVNDFFNLIVIIKTYHRA